MSYDCKADCTSPRSGYALLPDRPWPPAAAAAAGAGAGAAAIAVTASPSAAAPQNATASTFAEDAVQRLHQTQRHWIIVRKEALQREIADYPQRIDELTDALRAEVIRKVLVGIARRPYKASPLSLDDARAAAQKVHQHAHQALGCLERLFCRLALAPIDEAVRAFPPPACETVIEEFAVTDFAYAEGHLRAMLDQQGDSVIERVITRAPDRADQIMLSLAIRRVTKIQIEHISIVLNQSNGRYRGVLLGEDGKPAPLVQRHEEEPLTQQINDMRQRLFSTAREISKLQKQWEIQLLCEAQRRIPYGNSLNSVYLFAHEKLVFKIAYPNHELRAQAFSRLLLAPEALVKSHKATLEFPFTTKDRQVVERAAGLLQPLIDQKIECSVLYKHSVLAAALMQRLDIADSQKKVAVQGLLGARDIYYANAFFSPKLTEDFLALAQHGWDYEACSGDWWETNSLTDFITLYLEGKITRDTPIESRDRSIKGRLEEIPRLVAICEGAWEFVFFDNEFTLGGKRERLRGPLNHIEKYNENFKLPIRIFLLGLPFCHVPMAKSTKEWLIGLKKERPSIAQAAHPYTQKGDPAFWDTLPNNVQKALTAHIQSPQFQFPGTIKALPLHIRQQIKVRNSPFYDCRKTRTDIEEYVRYFQLLYEKYKNVEGPDKQLLEAIENFRKKINSYEDFSSSFGDHVERIIALFEVILENFPKDSDIDSNFAAVRSGVLTLDTLIARHVEGLLFPSTAVHENDLFLQRVDAAIAYAEKDPAPTVYGLHMAMYPFLGPIVDLAVQVHLCTSIMHQLLEIRIEIKLDQVASHAFDEALKPRQLVLQKDTVAQKAEKLKQAINYFVASHFDLFKDVKTSFSYKNWGVPQARLLSDVFNSVSHFLTQHAVIASYFSQEWRAKIAEVVFFLQHTQLPQFTQEEHAAYINFLAQTQSQITFACLKTAEECLGAHFIQNRLPKLILARFNQEYRDEVRNQFLTEKKNLRTSQTTCANMLELDPLVVLQSALEFNLLPGGKENALYKQVMQAAQEVRYVKV